MRLRSKAGLVAARAFGRSFSELFWHAHKARALPGDHRVNVVRDLRYGRHDRRQVVDLYLPADAGRERPIPFLYFVHGGGWMMCDRKMSAAVGRTLAARGLAVAAPGYRLVPEVGLADQQADVAAGLRAVVGEGARRFGLDTSRFALAGESAGAHLAARLAQSYQRDLPSPLAFVGLYGLYDLSHLARRAPFGHDVMVDALREGRPAGAMVSDHTALRPMDLHGLPVLLQHGDRDMLVGVRQSRVFAEHLRALGHDVQLEVYPGAGHGFIYDGSPPNRRNAARAYRQLYKFLLRHGVAPRTPR